MAKGKRIVVTGIPGSGTTDFCARYDAAVAGKLRINNYHFGDMLLDLAQESPLRPPVPAENLLNLQPELLRALGDRAFDYILAQATKDQRRYDRMTFDLHTLFFWDDAYTNAYNWHNLAQLGADMFVTLIEKPSTIRERQLATPQGRMQNHDLRDLLLWQNAEVNIVNSWASNFGRPHYILPGQQDPLTIESLLTSAFLVYFQMPMTDANGEADAKITAFKEQLLELGRKLIGLPTPLIDPRTIDIERGDGISPREALAIDRQTVHRDLNWYIRKASDLVAYYPIGTTLSKGVGDESTRGFETGKNVFVIYPKEQPSPFMGIATQVFVSADEFFEFFSAYLPQRIAALSRVL